MSCKSCKSERQSNLTAEVAIHFPGLNGLDKPIVSIFPKLLVCLNCGFTEFARAAVEPYLLTVPHLQHLPEAGQDGCETRLSSAGQQATPIV
jgi:hypothetical protein